MAYKIFVSYAKSDTKFILNSGVYKKLVTNGYIVLNDLADKDNTEKIEAKIKESDFFIWAVSNEYLASTIYMKQFMLARSLKKHIIQLLMSENINLGLLPDELDGILDKQEIVEVPNNPNVYFEIINTIGTIISPNNEGNFASIRKIHFEKTFKLNGFENLTKIFDANENAIVGVESNPFRVHVFSKDTLEFEKTTINTQDLFLVTDICRLNGFEGNLLISGTNSNSNMSFLYIINSRTYEVISRKCLVDNYVGKGLTTTKAKKKFLNSCAENVKKNRIYILDNFQKANILVFNYKLQFIKELHLELPSDYTNIFMRKLRINSSSQSIFLTNAINNCIHEFHLITLSYKRTFSSTLDMNFRELYLDNYENLLTLSWNNPYNGFNVFDKDGNHIKSFNLPFSNEKNRLFHPNQAIFLNSNRMIIMDGNYTNLLHSYSIEY